MRPCGARLSRKVQIGFGYCAGVQAGHGCRANRATVCGSSIKPSTTTCATCTPLGPTSRASAWAKPRSANLAEANAEKLAPPLTLAVAPVNMIVPRPRRPSPAPFRGRPAWRPGNRRAKSFSSSCTDVSTERSDQQCVRRVDEHIYAVADGLDGGDNLRLSREIRNKVGIGSPASRTAAPTACDTRCVRDKPTTSYPADANVVARFAPRPSPIPATSSNGRVVVISSLSHPIQDAGEEYDLRHPARRERQRAQHGDFRRVDDEVNQPRAEIQDGCEPRGRV